MHVIWDSSITPVNKKS